MSHLTFFILFAAVFISNNCTSQKKWDGGAGSNQWSNALNWTGNTLPSVTDDVVLDNALVTGNYTVILPSAAVTVKTITISPAASKTIELALPSTNNVVPGLTVSGPGYGLTINSGGTFRNSSGSTSGSAVRVTDSIRINNEGRYVHNSVSGHSTNVQVLAMISGTERGIFELDIPAASSTISISGRTFGKFVLRSTAAGGTCNYTAAGTSRVNIRNTLEIGTGVNFNLNCSDTIFVGGDLLQESGTLNLGNSTRSVVLSVLQNITQNTGGIITETGTGSQTILINGSGFQLVVFRGIIANQVALVKDATGIVLLKSAVSLPYKFVLKDGRIVTTQGLITLQPACTIEADSLSGDTFIDGPLKKDGLINQSFLFPVGKSGTMRWMQIKNATGNFTVEYFRNDPKSLSNTNGSGIHHISAVEYWDVTTEGSTSAAIKLSFVHPGSGGVTNLSSLRVARLINGIWEDAGNADVSGTPGSDGWVSSNAVSGFSANSKSFALASAMGLENPLPLSSLRLNGVKIRNSLMFSWKADRDMHLTKFELQRSYDGLNFKTIDKIFNADFYSCYMENRNSFFRLFAIAEDEQRNFISNVVFFSFKNVIRSVYMIFDVNGRFIKQLENFAPSALSALPRGIYFVKELPGNVTIKYYKR